MKLEHWMQLIFSTVILGGLGFLVVNLFDMKGTLSSVSMKVDTTDQRLARIADSLPEVKARIAWEEINRPISGFVAATFPKENEMHKWISSVNVYDKNSGKLQTYTLAMEKNHKDFLSYVIAGKIREEGSDDPSFAELMSYSSHEKEPVIIPASLNAHISFVLRGSNVSEYAAYLKTVTGKEPNIKDVGQLKNWKEVAAKLEEIK